MLKSGVCTFTSEDIVLELKAKQEELEKGSMMNFSMHCLNLVTSVQDSITCM